MQTISTPRLIGAIASAIAFIVSPLVSADVPDRATGTLSGLYKVTASNDPAFPMTANAEWFIDFGRGFEAGRLSGNAAVSLRQNPNVKVRLMVWQYLPQQNQLIVGNPFSEGSRKAVARAVWQPRFIAGGMTLERDNCQVVLKRPDPDDY